MKLFWYLWDDLLFADHNVKNHIVGMLHSDRTDLSEILNCLFNVVFNDAVVRRYAYAFSCEDS